MSRCEHCGLDPEHDLVPIHIAHLQHTVDHLVDLTERNARTMTDFATATTDAINELGTLAEELIAALKATPVPDPAVQDAADRLEAAVTAAKSSDPTPAPVDTAPPATDTPPLASVPAPVDEPTPPATDPTPDPGTPSTLGTES